MQTEREGMLPALHATTPTHVTMPASGACAAGTPQQREGIAWLSSTRKFISNGYSLLNAVATPCPCPPVLLTACGDVFIYKRTYTWQVWGCLGLMLVSAVAGASTDSRFTWLGYSWQIANCFFTSAYALYLRSVMDKVAEHTTNKQKVRAD